MTTLATSKTIVRVINGVTVKFECVRKSTMLNSGKHYTKRWYWGVVGQANRKTCLGKKNKSIIRSSLKYITS